MHQSNNNTLVFAAYSLSLELLRHSHEILASGSFGSVAAYLGYVPRASVLSPRYVRCAACGTTWHNLLGVQVALVRNCGRCTELGAGSIEGDLDLCNGINVINFQLLRLSQQAMIDFNTTAERILCKKLIQVWPVASTA